MLLLYNIQFLTIILIDQYIHLMFINYHNILIYILFILIYDIVNFQWQYSNNIVILLIYFVWHNKYNNYSLYIINYS